MRQYSVFTNEYDADIEKLLTRRLSQKDESGSIIKTASDGGRRLDITVDSPAGLSALSASLAELMLIDLRYFEMAKMVDALPFNLNEKKAILERALGKVRVQGVPAESAAEIIDYLGENNVLNLEGYLHFRLKDALEKWSVYVDAAAEDVLLEGEYAELMDILGLFSVMEQPKSGHIRVLLNPDGSCTIMGDGEDGTAFRIDCAPGGNEGVLSMLIGMAPASIALYDLSFGKCEKLRTAIETVFGAKLTDDE